MANAMGIVGETVVFMALIRVWGATNRRQRREAHSTGLPDIPLHLLPGSHGAHDVARPGNRAGVIVGFQQYPMK